MTIKLDSTPLTVVVVCQKCNWRQIVTDRGQGWAAGARHLDYVHPDARNVARMNAANNGITVRSEKESRRWA